MSRHFKVHDLLDAGELEKLKAFAREPGRTVDQVHEWLEANGFTIGRSSAYNWFRNFLEEDRWASSGELAAAIVEMSKDKGAVEISDAATLKLSQLIFEASLSQQATGAIDTKNVQRLSASLKNVITGKRHLEKLQEEMSRRQQEALAAAEKEAKGGASGEAVVAKVREILGIAA